MEISKFNFEKDWHLVEPYLNDPEVSELLDQGMLSCSLRVDKWAHLPLWDAENGHGPWEYTKLDAFSDYAMEMAFEDPQMEVLNLKYGEKLEKEGLEFEVLYDYDGKDSVVLDIVENYWKEYRNIEGKYYPQKNTYRWYQCFGAADYLSAWSKKLAEKTFPDHTWKIYRKYNKRFTNPVFNITELTGCTTTIGRSENGDFLIFDIMLFKNSTVDEILKAVGLNRNKLQNELNKIIKKQLMKISREIRMLAKQIDRIASKIAKIEAKKTKSKTTKNPLINNQRGSSIPAHT